MLIHLLPYDLLDLITLFVSAFVGAEERCELTGGKVLLQRAHGSLPLAGGVKVAAPDCKGLDGSPVCSRENTKKV